MEIGNYVEAHNSTHGWRGVVVDYDHDEGFVTLDRCQRWSAGATVQCNYPVTLIEAAYEWVPARFQPTIEGGMY